MWHWSGMNTAEVRRSVNGAAAALVLVLALVRLVEGTDD